MPLPGGAKKYVFMVMFPFLIVMLLVSVYSGAMHSPSPKDMPVAVVGQSAQAEQLASSLEATDGSPLDVRVVSTVAEAEQLLHDREISGAFALPAGADGDAVLYTAQAAGAAQASIVESIFQPVADAQHLDMDHKDVAPLPASDGMGITVLFTAIGWMLSGYLVVTVVSSGAPELASLRRMVPLMAGWAAVMSTVVWLLVGPVIGAVDGHAWALLGLGWLSVFSVAMAQTLLARLFGPLAVLPGLALFMFLGVPSSNIMMSIYTVPGMFTFLHQVLPLPAAGEALRSVLYFGGDGAGGHLVVLGVWAVAGLLLTAGIDLLRHRRKKGRAAAEAEHITADSVSSEAMASA
ncbi:ABC transporter permease [Streptomyces sp. NBC_00564]|uniref:ABC transporter permease n=1 Tax=Streptomyces sp. NBC_00564 TaxID=2903663 RepID=UPI002FCDD704|nr:ABC transporter permease [Streptomyces sp. NBC_00564]